MDAPSQPRNIWNSLDALQAALCLLNVSKAESFFDKQHDICLFDSADNCGLKFYAVKKGDIPASGLSVFLAVFSAFSGVILLLQ